MIAASISAGLALHSVTGVDSATALLATAPGGAGDMTAIALGIGAEATLVAAIHTVRQVLVLIVLMAGIQGFVARGRDRGSTGS